MVRNSIICAAIAAAVIPAAAMADDPRDPAMRSAAARARDHEIIRQLNLKEAAKVRERDARYAQTWRTYRNVRNGRDDPEYAARVQDHQRAMADYADRRAKYEHDMAAWRRAVAACRDGDYSACDN
ncbi:MAG: hypothetical protein KGL48_02385 [Sphingomonadales bacterium]|nr:hypothetical protein [Sphingomonadales bacterium]MDE2569680.1 hypothetical protein [Sphingomonadales bacterium]